ncbi:MAG: selenophosphate synthase [Bacillota bacterium]|nr:selenophosphate synthase [Bacillota bacterium]
MKEENYRDVSVIDLENDLKIFIACDSSGGIGLKEMDEFKVPPEITGFYTVNVITSELEALGVTPKVIVNNVCAEMNDTGKMIIEGINKYLNENYSDDSIKLTGSTEENFKTYQTSLGMVAIGYKKVKDFKFYNTKSQNELILVGKPKVGEEVLINQSENIDASTVRVLRSIKGVVDIVPVGSKGIKYESKNISKNRKLNLKFYKNKKINIEKSSGPATCCIATIDKDIISIEEIKKLVNKPIERIGIYT